MADFSIDDLTFGYRKGQPIFENLDLQLGLIEAPGRVIAVMGKSGSGKTTLLRLLAGLEIPWSGKISSSSESLKISFLPQDAVFFEHLTIKENARYFEKIRAVHNRFKLSTYNQIADELDLKQLLDSDRKVSELSGGERQRVALLRALSISPDVLFLDEPCVGLDVGLKQEFLSQLRIAVETRGLLALYVTHHADEARIVADEVVFLRHETDGRIDGIWKQKMSAIIHAPAHIEIAEFFLGPVFNQLRCFYDDHFLKIRNRDGSLGQLLQSDREQDIRIIGFRPENVIWDDGGISVDWQANSAVYSFCSFFDGANKFQVVGQRSIIKPSSFRLHGKFYAFSDSGAFIDTFEIS